jgi:polyphenol oxidase
MLIDSSQPQNYTLRANGLGYLETPARLRCLSPSALGRIQTAIALATLALDIRGASHLQLPEDNMTLSKKLEDPKRDETAADSRRKFLHTAGFTIGGLALLGLPQGTIHAQTPTPIPTPDPNENCFPPTYNLNPPPGQNNMPIPVPFKPEANLQQRERKCVFDLNATEQARLNQAYVLLRSLPPDDPRGWLPQAHVHCFYCAGSADNPTPIEIHGGWFFFPWHRAYLYFHERILATLLGDDTFALPYWNWDTPNTGTAFPPVYSNPGALFDLSRGATVGSTPTLESVFDSNNINVDQILQETNYELFMGSSADAFNNYGGGIENGPHGLVHLWSGQPSLQDSSGVIDMGVLQTAARDPLFFCHHANVDRMWYLWNNMSNQNPADCGWLQQTWQFYDQNQQWTSISVADVVDTENSLKYSYMLPQKSLRSTAFTIAQKRQSVFTAPQTQEKTVQTGTPTTKEITIPQDERRRIRAEAVRPSLARKTVYVLHIDGIDVPPDASAIVRVFVDLPTANAATSASIKNYVGFFTVLPQTLKRGLHKHKLKNVAFNVSDKMGDVLRLDNKVQVTLVPVRGLNQRADNINLTYQKVYLERK